MFSLCSLYKTHLICLLYFSLSLKQIIMSLRYAIIKSFRYSPNIQLILFQNIAGAFINLNCSTISLNKPFLVLNTLFYLSPSLILIQWYTHFKSIFIKIFVFLILSQISLINSNRYQSFFVMLFNCLQLIYNYNFLFFFGLNNTGYPVDNYKGLILPNFRFFWTKSLNAYYLTSVNLYIRKNLRLIPGFKSTI